ncbi:glycosyl hydrolase [Clostridium sp. OM05-6BH]|uniref:glycoside hydrolase family 3 C-terminal domain-containing protein n=1 Tax=unclassified Clostridium TaxID=2614128 RepID=UPI000E4CA602|nr:MULTISPECIES: glycoside hydrolase family 3 C-terminal domain-containing protein [unclassified Clostridium]RHV10058.1 glycosyl hydrolase [Clostridium sp. OM05-9BH]RHV16503.1 glycosyl hydrolase [Clostridium sp. OM05-6BH]
MEHVLDVKKLVNELTLEEKASLCSGADFWHTEAIDRLNIPAAMVSDGPHGIRKQENLADHMGVAESIKAIGFPTASAMACSFDRDLLHKVGDALGEECVAEDLAVLLGPGINMKRSPICGRNFEYYSEDPVVAGELGAAFVNGVQEHGVGTSLKHFAANNQEWRRMSISAEIDERTLREIYLAAFETAVKKAQPWTIMCSYNRINGVYSCENDWLLNKVLRDEWGFEGLVMTDWGAMDERVPSLKAGLDLEMPDCHGETDKLIVKAVQSGELEESVLDTAVERILTMVDKYLTARKDIDPASMVHPLPSSVERGYDVAAHHALARTTAEQSAVLLKNEDILPLQKDKKIAFIGEFAKVPRIQGGGSSHINNTSVESALDVAGDSVSYAQGFHIDEETTDETLLQEAITLAKGSDVAVIFAGLPDSFESEGFDRTHLNMPANQNELIARISEVQPNVVVVLHSGSPIAMPWLDKVAGVLQMYLAGQASGGAAVNLLFGDATPCGKLAETFPLHLEDNPSYLNFPGNREKVCYQEGVFIGYRYYDKKKMDVLFPFGYGLSYTDFTYSNMKVTVNGKNAADVDVIKETDEIVVSADITNTGNCDGAEIVQLYIKNPVVYEIRPEKELRDFAKVFLKAGETKTVTFTLNARAFSYYETRIHDWYAESGDYEILLASSSRDIRLQDTVSITGSKKIPFVADYVTTCEDVELFAKDGSALDEMLRGSGFAEATDHDGDDSMGSGTADMMKAMFTGTPLHSILSFSSEELTYEDIQDTIRKLNEAEKNNNY